MMSRSLRGLGPWCKAWGFWTNAALPVQVWGAVGLWVWITPLQRLGLGAEPSGWASWELLPCWEGRKICFWATSGALGFTC